VLSRRGLCIGLIVLPQESYSVPVCLIVIPMPQGGPGTVGNIEPQKKNGDTYKSLLMFTLSKHSLFNLMSIHGS
jgi:hypothetical protein